MSEELKDLKQAAQAIVENPQAAAPTTTSTSYLEDIRSAYRAGIEDAKASQAVAPATDPRDQPPAAKGQGYHPSAAPVPTRREPTSEITSWTLDDIAAMKSAGTFRENLDRARNALPGGASGFFKPRR